MHSIFSLKKRKFNPPVSFDSKQYFDRQSHVIDRLLLTNTSSAETPPALVVSIPKETNEASSAAKDSSESLLSPSEPTARDEGEAWSSEEGT